MADQESLDGRTPDGAPPGLAGPATRVDPAHPRADASPTPTPAPAPAEPVAAFERTPAATAQHVRLQAAQLATHLQRQQSAVDHREAELNARTAAIENQMRGARLWLDERHAELATAQEELDRRERELTAREAELNAAGTRRSLPADATELERKAVELERREAELEAMAGRVAQRFEASESQLPPTAAQALARQRAHLERAEKMLASAQAEVERQRRTLHEQQREHAEAAEAEQRRLAAIEQRHAEEHKRQQQQLKRLADGLAAREAALERTRNEVKHGQQDALEMRLATEELWSRLCGTMAPAALVQSLAEVRRKLAAEWASQKKELNEERTQLQELAKRLAEQHDKLSQQRTEAQTWVDRRRLELEESASVLAARERQLEQQQAQLADRLAEWQTERSKLEQEVRTLLSKAESPGSCAAA